MTDSNYREVIDDVQDILTELLDDPEHGKLTFKGLHGLDDLTITGPNGAHGLNCLPFGTVLAIDNQEWMAIGRAGVGRFGEYVQWQHVAGNLRFTSAELYIRALRSHNNLCHCHKGLRV